jgi:hypothetical protein
LYFSNKIKLKKPFLYKYFDKKRVRKERLDSAYVYFQKAMNEAERRNNKAWKGIIRGNLGTLYYK